MEFYIKRNQQIEPAVRRIALEQIESAINDINNSSLDRHEVVHRVRKQCKRQRALLRLVRANLGGIFHDENRFFRDLSRELSALRDAQALLESFDRTVEHFAGEYNASEAGRIRDHLLELRQAEGGDRQLADTLECRRRDLEEASGRIEQWTVDESGFAALRPGLLRTYRRARQALAEVRDDPNTENLHEWRKRVKYHWYHTCLLRQISPRILHPHRALADELGALLGQDHDLAMLSHRMQKLFSENRPDRSEAHLLTLAAKLRKKLQTDAMVIGRNVLAEEPQRLADRWHKYWQVWQEQSESDGIWRDPAEAI